MTLTLLELEALVESLNKTYSRNKMKIIAEDQTAYSRNKMKIIAEDQTDHKEQTGHDIQQEIKIKGQKLETASFKKRISKPEILLTHYIPKVPDAYLGQPIYSILQGIQLELLLGRTRSDRPCLLHRCIYARACSTSIVT